MTHSRCSLHCMCLKKPSINYSYGLNWTVYGETESSHTIILPVPVATKACFYFRQESLIEYDREKMRVWGRWRLQILPNNQEDASDQPVSPSCACYLISFILLVNSTGMKVWGGGVSSTVHLQWGRTIWNSSAILMCPCLETSEFRERIPPKTKMHW